MTDLDPHAIILGGWTCPACGEPTFSVATIPKLSSGELYPVVGVCDTCHEKRELKGAQPIPPSPGSPHALLLGCQCPVIDNARGRGQVGALGERWYHFNDECPLHGTGAWRDLRV